MEFAALLLLLLKTISILIFCVTPVRLNREPSVARGSPGRNQALPHPPSKRQLICKLYPIPHPRDSSFVFEPPSAALGVWLPCPQTSHRISQTAQGPASQPSASRVVSIYAGDICRIIGAAASTGSAATAVACKNSANASARSRSGSGSDADTERVREALS